jgi:hypothetical protein
MDPVILDVESTSLDEEMDEEERSRKEIADIRAQFGEESDDDEEFGEALFLAKNTKKERARCMTRFQK